MNNVNKCDILLKILNGILKHNNDNQINDLRDFSIKRIDLITPTNSQFIENHYDEIFTYFKKNKSHYRRALTKNYIVVLLKNMCKEIGLEWTCTEIEYGLMINGNKYRRRTIKYTIKQPEKNQ